MDKAMTTVFVLLICIASLGIDEGSGIGGISCSSYPSTLSVSAVSNFIAWFCF